LVSSWSRTGANDCSNTGKYQLQVFPEAGHFIQEDQPSKTAQVLADFYRRNDRSALVLPPKVGDLQAAAAMKKGAGVLEKGHAK
jgi:protein phosphatase methylesterase 1